MKKKQRASRRRSRPLISSPLFSMCLFPSVRSRSCVFGGGRGEEPKVKEEETSFEAKSHKIRVLDF
ncbi:unnamed protein product [Brassica oleracea var. botrytis]